MHKRLNDLWKKMWDSRHTAFHRYGKSAIGGIGSFCAARLILCISLVVSSCFVWSQTSLSTSSPSIPQPTDSAPIFHSSTSLVLVDVIAQDSKTGLPLN